MGNTMTTTKRCPAKELILFIFCLFAIWSVRATFLYAIDASISTARPSGRRPWRTLPTTASLRCWLVERFLC
jgi:hypothetical protein